MSSDQPVPPSIPPRKKPGSPGAARPSTGRPTVVRPVKDVPAQGSPAANPGAAAAAAPEASGQETTATPIVPRAATPTPTPPAAKEPIAKEPIAKAPAAQSPSASSKPASPTSAPASIPVPRVAAPKTPIAPIPAPTATAAAPPRTTTSPAAAAGDEEPAHEAPQTPTWGPVATSVLRALKSATATVAGATVLVAGAPLRATKFPLSADGAPPRPDSIKADPTIAANDTQAASAAPRNTPRSGAAPDGARLPAPTARDGAPRRVRLSVSRVDPWSVMKLSFLLSVAVGIMIVVAAAVVWFVLDGLAVFTKVNDMITEIAGKESSIDILKYVEFSRVVSGATMVGVVDVILLTALSTIGAFLYNITAALVGGVSLTLTDD